jgi:hypothetical protein
VSAHTGRRCRMRHGDDGPRVPYPRRSSFPR